MVYHIKLSFMSVAAAKGTLSAFDRWWYTTLNCRLCLLLQLKAHWVRKLCSCFCARLVRCWQFTCIVCKHVEKTPLQTRLCEEQW